MNKKNDPRIAVILAGGQSQRMNGQDKAMVMLQGRPMIDHIIDRLHPQTDHILIAGPTNYGTAYQHVPDERNGPKGPAAGLWSALQWLLVYQPEFSGFLTVPIDGPFFPLNLYDKLATGASCTVATNAKGIHPTFGYWHIATLQKVMAPLCENNTIALRDLANRCNASPVDINIPSYALMNINTPSDLSHANTLFDNIKD